MKIAIVRLSALGDIVHSMIVLQFIKKKYPESEIDWFIEKRFFEVLENNPHINQIHKVNLKSVNKSKSFFLIWKELRKIRTLSKYDLVIDMQGLLKSALIAQKIPSDITLGFDKTSLRESFSAKFYSQTYKMDYAANIVERNVALVSHALKLSINQEDISNKKPILYPSKKYVFNDINYEKQNIAIVPGASFQSKCYPVEKFAELTTKIDANFFVIWGSKAEKVMANDIKTLSPSVQVMPKLSLDALMSLISQMNLVIGSDTGPTHMAWALNVPSITLFGPTPGNRNTYITSINKIIESDSEVDPNKINKNDYSIKNIIVGDIVKIAEYLFKVSQ